MKALIILSLFINGLAFAETIELPPLKVIALYQIDDESKAGFDFFTAEAAHSCGGKESNRFRSYSRHDAVAERKFQLVLSALNNEFLINTQSLGCEGNALKVGRIGVRR